MLAYFQSGSKPYFGSKNIKISKDSVSTDVIITINTCLIYKILEVIEYASSDHQTAKKKNLVNTKVVVEYVDQTKISM